jgi:UDP-N-acetylglucosamine transferase subunit ALG13
MAIKIFSIVGSTYPLDRLTMELDLLGEDKKYQIFAQVGESKYTPKNITYKGFLNYNEMQSKIKWADFIISHAGAGSIIDLLTSKKKFILFPRLKKYGEAVDDHQLEICKAFEKKYHIKYTTDSKQLTELIAKIKSNSKTKTNSKLSKEITKLIQAL